MAIVKSDIGHLYIVFGDYDRNVQKEGDGLVGGNKRLLIVLNDERESRRTEECRARRARVFVTYQGLSWFTQCSEISAFYMKEMYVVEFSDLWF